MKIISKITSKKGGIRVITAIIVAVLLIAIIPILSMFNKANSKDAIENLDLTEDVGNDEVEESLDVENLNVEEIVEYKEEKEDKQPEKEEPNEKEEPKKEFEKVKEEDITEPRTKVNSDMWTKANVNFRKEANTDSDIIKVLNVGTKVKALEKTANNWYYVESGGRKGYVSADYLSDTEVKAVKAESPKQETMKKEAPKKEEPKKEVSKNQETPKKETPKKEEPKKQEHKKEEPKKEEPKKEEPKKDDGLIYSEDGDIIGGDVFGDGPGLDMDLN